MIISRTPFRISFFGGGTDYVPWFKEHGGMSLVTTIDKYCYITCRYLPPFFEYNSRIVYSKMELVKNNNEISHPSVREILRHLNILEGVEIHHDADLPARTGLGSSSAFAVGLLNTFHNMLGKKPSKMELAEEAIYVEQELCKENVGCQDQISTALGGLNVISFDWDEKPVYNVEKVKISQERIRQFEENLMLYFTGFSRIASEIAKHQIENIPNKTRELKRMMGMVEEGLDILHTGDLDDFGRLLHEGWALKRSMSHKVSNHEIDELYDKALQAGALGGKILGAGGGGFMLLYVPKENQARVRQDLEGFLEVPFKFENTGTEIIGNYE